MSAKPKVAFYWCASCGGCEEAVVDLAEDILGVVEAVEVVFWPVAMDFKKREVEGLADGEIVATFLNGAIRTSEQEEMAQLLRRKSVYMIAYGACAQLGGIPGLANQFGREALLRWVYEAGPTVVNPGGVRPQAAVEDEGRDLSLPVVRSVVRALDQVVGVDYYLPGCPPTPKLTKAAVGALLSGKLPAKGSVLAPDTAVCEECPRKGSKPVDLSLVSFARPHQKVVEAEKCLLAQGLVCMGPATRGGCEAVCVGANMPCTGCFGGTSRVRDQGAKMLSSLCANVAGKEGPEIRAVLEGIPDPVGTFYRYGLAKSLLRGRVDGGWGGDGGGGGKQPERGEL